MIESDATKEALDTFTCISENEYQNKQIGMAQYQGVFSCQCSFSNPCTTTCVNKELLIECSKESCPVSSDCKNMRFQNKEYKQVNIIKTNKKGFGVIANEDIEQFEFILEYVGEFITEKKFHERIKKYTKEKHQHFYGMCLRPNEYVDATKKGGIARFCNHSCNPNCIIQQWIVNDRLRMGLFAIRDIDKNEELTFDYNFERFGKPQKCFCEDERCRGYIGQAKEDMSEVAKVERSDQMSNAKPFTKEDEIIMIMRDFLKEMSVDQFEQCLYRLLKSDKMMILVFINHHGLTFLKYVLNEYTKQPFYGDVVGFCDLLPLTRKNYLVKVGLLEEIKTLIANTEMDKSYLIKLQALHDKWDNLKMDIIITKSKKRPANIVKQMESTELSVNKKKKVLKYQQPQQQQRSPPLLIEDSRLPKDWKCFQDHRGYYYEHYSGRRQSKRPMEVQAEDSSAQSPSISTPTSTTRIDTNLDDLDVETLFSEIEQKQLDLLKQSFEQDKHKNRKFKQFKNDVSSVVIDKLTKYAPQMRLEKTVFKQHAKNVNIIIHLDH